MADLSEWKKKIFSLIFRTQFLVVLMLCTQKIYFMFLNAKNFNFKKKIKIIVTSDSILSTISSYSKFDFCVL